MDWNQLWMGLGLAIPATVLGVLGYQRSRKVDAVSAQSGVASDSREGTAQVIAGLNSLIDQLQEDYTGARADIKALKERVEAVILERDALKVEVARLRRKFGENGPG